MLQKIKKIIFVIIASALVLFILFCCAYAFFKNVPIDRSSLDVTFTVTKLDENGEQIGAFPITINGYIEEYLLQDDRLNVHIESFDGYIDFLPHNHNNVDGGIFDFAGLRMTRYYATGSNGLAYFTIYFSEDHNRWLLIVEDYMFQINGRYVASTDSNDTLQDLKDYFGGLLLTN